MSRMSKSGMILHCVTHSKLREENALSTTVTSWVNLRRRLRSIDTLHRQKEISWREKLESLSQEFRCRYHFHLRKQLDLVSVFFVFIFCLSCKKASNLVTLNSFYFTLNHGAEPPRTEISLVISPRGHAFSFPTFVVLAVPPWV